MRVQMFDFKTLKKDSKDLIKELTVKGALGFIRLQILEIPAPNKTIYVQSKHEIYCFYLSYYRMLYTLVKRKRNLFWKFKDWFNYIFCIKLMVYLGWDSETRRLKKKFNTKNDEIVAKVFYKQYKQELEDEKDLLKM